MSDAPILRVVLQRHSMDCGVAVLAMLFGVSYEEALVAVSADCHDVLTGGMRTIDLRRAAARLGYRLRSIRRGYDLENETGALTVRSPRWHDEHLVVLREGLLVETDGLIWEPETFLGHYHAEHGPLFVVEPL